MNPEGIDSSDSRYLSHKQNIPIITSIHLNWGFERRVFSIECWDEEKELDSLVAWLEVLGTTWQSLSHSNKKHRWIIEHQSFLKSLKYILDKSKQKVFKRERKIQDLNSRIYGHFGATVPANLLSYEILFIIFFILFSET